MTTGKISQDAQKGSSALPFKITGTDAQLAQHRMQRAGWQFFFEILNHSSRGPIVNR